MYYFRYFIKCCIRNISRLICKPKVLLVLGLSFLLLFCFGKIDVNAAEGEPIISYNTIDGITVDSSGIISFNGFKCYYIPVYNNQTISYAYTTSSPAEIRTCFTSSKPSVGVPIVGSWTQSNRDTGYSIEIVQQSSINGFFCVFVYPTSGFVNITFYDNSSTSDAIVNQTQQIIESDKKNTQDIINNNNKNTQDIINNYNQSSDKIVESQEEINDSLTSTDYDESVLNIDTSDVADVDDSSSNQLFTTIFTNFSNLLDNSNWSQVEFIEIGLPYTDGKIELRSDILSKIVGNSFLKTLINIAWYSLFGLYCFKFTTNIYRAIKSGDILNGLNLSDEVITSTML